MSEKDQTIQDLEKEIRDWESAASQSEYDAAAAQSAIDALSEENGQLIEENNTLVQENSALTEEKENLEIQVQEPDPGGRRDSGGAGRDERQL